MLQNENGNVHFQKCNSEFKITSGGRTDITRHIKSEKHNLAVQSSASSANLSTYFCKSEFLNK